jgi:hypothetical protein
VKTKTMKIRNKHNVIIAHDASTGTDNLIYNDKEFDLEEGMSVVVRPIRHMLVEIIRIKE